MDSPISVLLRDGTHSGADNHLALKVHQIAISIAREPTQIAVPGVSPQLQDLGTARPSITMSGIIDTIGQDPANTGSDNNTPETWGMEYISVTDGSTTKKYYIPYKNYLEDRLTTWLTNTGGIDLQIEIGDATRPVATGSSILATGGAIYKVALGRMQFTQEPGAEDRWVFTMQFISEWREGIS